MSTSQTETQPQESQDLSPIDVVDQLSSPEVALYVPRPGMVPLTETYWVAETPVGVVGISASRFGKESELKSARMFLSIDDAESTRFSSDAENLSYGLDTIAKDHPDAALVLRAMRACVEAGDIKDCRQQPLDDLKASFIGRFPTLMIVRNSLNLFGF